MTESFHCRYQIVSSEIGETETFDVRTGAVLTGLHGGLIVEVAEAQIVRSAGRAGPDEDAPPVFDERGLLRLRQVADLRENQQVSLRTLRLIVHLLDRLEETETRLRALEEQLR